METQWSGRRDLAIVPSRRCSLRRRRCALLLLLQRVLQRGFGASAARETLLVLFVVVRVLSKVGRQCIVLNPNPHRHPFNLSFAPPLQPFPALASSFNATLDQCRCQSPSSPIPLAFLCYISFSVRELVPIRSRPRPRQGWEGFLAGRWGMSPYHGGEPAGVRGRVAPH